MIMRTAQWILAATLAAALPATARAQNQTPTPTPPAAPGSPGTPTAADPPLPQPTPAPVPAQPQSRSDNQFSSFDNEWIASGFVGSDFGAKANEASPHYGGSIGYLWRGWLGGELLAASTPDFELTNAFFTDRPMVNSYMANVIGAVPFGVDGQYQPFVSGGFGAVQLRQDIFNVIGTPTAGSTVGDAVKFGGNIGAGMAAYVRNIGIRGDVRYFRTRNDINNDISTPSDAIADTALAGLDFWRANIGVAFRW
jgi:hypothetical protein